MSKNPDSIYSELPWEGSNALGLGYALITMVEPHRGYEREYNRWYEDDHFFSGAMFEPYMFAGRRWVATRELQLMRYPKETPTPVAKPDFTTGCYLGTYWVCVGRMDHHQRFTKAANARLEKEGRKYEHRDLVFSEFQDYIGAVYRNDYVPRDVYALHDPYPGLVMEVIDTERPEQLDELLRWLREEHLPSLVQTAESPVDQVLVFRTNAPREHHRPNAEDFSNGGRRATLLWFLSKDPREVWSRFFVPEGDRIAASGRGRVSFVGPFIPAKMGTDTYVEQLR